MKKVFLLLAISIVFFSCAKKEQATENTSNSNINVEFLFEKEGCKVYRFYDNGHAVYFTDCKGRIEYNYTTTTGKTSQSHRVQNETVE